MNTSGPGNQQQAVKTSRVVGLEDDSSGFNKIGVALLLSWQQSKGSFENFPPVSSCANDISYNIFQRQFFLQFQTKLGPLFKHDSVQIYYSLSNKPALVGHSGGCS